MTFDLKAAKRLAEQLAGDVLNQIERDGSISRENIAGQLLAGLVLAEASKPWPRRFLNRDDLYKVEGLDGPRMIVREISKPKPIGGLEALIAEYPDSLPDFSKLKFDGSDVMPEGAKQSPELSALYREACSRIGKAQAADRHIELWPDGVGLKNVGDVHVRCICPACVERRKKSLCGCEMCMHHTEAAEIQADAEKGRNRTAAEAKAIDQAEPRGVRRGRYIDDLQTVTVKLWRMDHGRRVPVEVTPAVEVTPDLIAATLRAIEENSPHDLFNSDQVVFPDGRVMTGLEVLQTGRTAAQIWEEMRRHQLHSTDGDPK